MNLLLYLSMFAKKVLLNALRFEETLCPWLWEQKQEAAGPVHCISHHKALQAGPCPAPPDLRDTGCWEHVVPVGEGKVMWTAPLRTRCCYCAVEVGAVCWCDGFSTASQLVPSTCDSRQSICLPFIPWQSYRGSGRKWFFCSTQLYILFHWMLMSG